MFTIKKDGNTVQLKTSLEIPFTNGYTYTFNFACNEEDYAGLLAGKLKETIENNIKKTRENEYQQGYKDGKNKQRKNTWFAPYLDR